MPATQVVERPSGATLHPPAQPDDHWRVIELADGRMARVSPPVADLWQALDGDATPEDLAASLGEGWSEAIVTEALASLAGAGLVETVLTTSTGALPQAAGRHHLKDRLTGRQRTKFGRLELAENGSIQFTLVRDLDRFPVARRLGAVLGGWPSAMVGLAMGVAGFANMVASWQTFATTLTSPASLAEMIALVLLMVLVSSLHELGHALRAIKVGAKVRRIGVMLFYLSPAMYCDITDAWRLDKRARVSTALAGTVASSAIVGVLSFLFTATGGRNVVLGALTVAMAASLFLNLLPLVKYDGYIAFMSYLDFPNLRAKAMREWKRRLAVVVAGGGDPNRPDSVLGKDWVVLYGILASLAPIGLLSAVAAQLGTELAAMGVLGFAIRGALVLFIAVLAARGILRVVAEFKAEGVPIRRRAVALTVFGLVLTCVLGGARVTEAVTTSFYVTDRGEVLALLPAGRGMEFSVGQEVTLSRVGILTDEPIARASIKGPPDDRELPWAATTPSIRGLSDTPRTMLAVPLAVIGSATALELRPGSGGSAAVVGRDVPLWRMLADLIILDAVSSIRAQVE
jgi:putative peptide zinc metalloprotease protein